MKIGIIIGCLGLGGAERVSVNLARWFIGQGSEVVFFNTKKPAEKEYDLPDGAARILCWSKNKVGITSNLRKALKKERPDAVIVMGTPMCVYAIPALTGLRIPTAVSERSSPGNAKIKKTTRVFSDLLVGSADAFIFQTEDAKKYFKKKIREKGRVIPNPIVASSLPDPYRGERTKRFVALGRLVAEKNYPLLIDAFGRFHKTHPEYVLEIYGDGPEREKLQARIDADGLGDSITLFRSRSDVLEHVKDARGFVLSSDLEGMPNALIEAMAIGIPSVSTDCPCGGPADLIEDGVSGILVPTGDSDALAGAIGKIADDAEFAGTLSANSVGIRERLDINVIGKEWSDVLTSILKTEKKKLTEDLLYETESKDNIKIIDVPHLACSAVRVLLCVEFHRFWSRVQRSDRHSEYCLRRMGGHYSQSG